MPQNLVFQTLDQFCYGSLVKQLSKVTIHNYFIRKKSINVRISIIFNISVDLKYNSFIEDISYARYSQPRDIYKVICCGKQNFYATEETETHFK